MKSSSRDCKLLGPVLVSFAYGEPHPETKQLLLHLRSCPSCRRELDDLRETRGWVEEILPPVDSAGVSSRARWLHKSLVVAAIAAGILGASMLFVDKPDREIPRQIVGAPTAGISHLLAAPPLAATLTSLAFALDGFDARLTALQEDLGGVEEANW